MCCKISLSLTYFGRLREPWKHKNLVLKLIIIITFVQCCCYYFTTPRSYMVRGCKLSYFRTVETLKFLLFLCFCQPPIRRHHLVNGSFSPQQYVLIFRSSCCCCWHKPFIAVTAIDPVGVLLISCTGVNVAFHLLFFPPTFF